MEAATTFETYLNNKGYRTSTIQVHLQQVALFRAWMQEQGITQIELLQYNDLLQYAQQEQQRGITKATVNNRIGSINKYLEFLKQEEQILHNPASTFRIRDTGTTVIQTPLSYDELVQLYNDYKTLDKESLLQNASIPQHVKDKSKLAQQRNVVIVGLLIWQGLHSGELQLLQTEHIHLDAGTIYIPATNRSNSRTLKLHTPQILTLHSYLYGGIREQFKPKEDELFTGSLHNIIYALVEELKPLQPTIKNALHIRASVILHWLKLHNKRQVQYMAGHKWIDSTEKYAVQEMDSLTDALSKFHPFG
jgi:site-specific recombinase XerD